MFELSSEKDSKSYVKFHLCMGKVQKSWEIAFFLTTSALYPVKMRRIELQLAFIACVYRLRLRPLAFGSLENGEGWVGDNSWTVFTIKESAFREKSGIFLKMLFKRLFSQNTVFQSCGKDNFRKNCTFRMKVWWFIICFVLYVLNLKFGENVPLFCWFEVMNC